MPLQGTVDSGFDQMSWDLRAYYTLRPELFFDRLATVQGTSLDKRGDSVRFTKVTDLAPSTTPLTEKVDVAGVNYADTNVDVTMTEYGNAIITTAKLRAFSYLDVDPVVANILGYNAGISVDTIAANALYAGTNVIYGGNATSRVTLGADATPDRLSSGIIRRAVAQLRTANVPGPTMMGSMSGMYVAFVHPHVSVDLRQETGGAAWRDPHVYSQPGEIWRGDAGTYEGVRFVETPRAGLLLAAGGGTPVADVYQTVVMGSEAIAKAYSATVSAPLPQVRPGPIVDILMRFAPLGWYWLGGYTIFRQESIRRIETTSTLGAGNAANL